MEYEDDNEGCGVCENTEASAKLYILEGLKRDGIIQDNPPMTEAKAAE